MITKILFSNPRLEYRVRRMVQTHWEQEVGGWFIVNGMNPLCWPGRFNYGAVQRAVGASFTLIDGVIVVPNLADHPERQFCVWDDDRARDMAKATAKTMGGYLMGWHSHPGNLSEPSQGDIAYYSHVAGGCWADFAIVTAYPFRVWPYDMTIGGVQAPQAGFKLECGEYVSWQRKAMRQFR